MKNSFKGVLGPRETIPLSGKQSAHAGLVTQDANGTGDVVAPGPTSRRITGHFCALPLAISSPPLSLPPPRFHWQAREARLLGPLCQGSASYSQTLDLPAASSLAASLLTPAPACLPACLPPSPPGSITPQLPSNEGVGAGHLLSLKRTVVLEEHSLLH